MMADKEKIFSIHRTTLFDRCLEDLRTKGGTAESAAKKAVDFINAVSGREDRKVREKFSFTRHGEARIRNCRKVDLGCGYRLVCLLKDGHFVLLYAGSHDDCSRWLMRNRRMTFELKEAAQPVSVVREQLPREEVVPIVGGQEGNIADAYEAELMSRIDDAVLRKVFSGLVNRSGSDTQ
jgi:hypothetical protein